MNAPNPQTSKLSIWQPIIIALIGALAGMSGTIGVKLMDNSKTVAEKDQQIATLEKKLNTITQINNATPIVVLQTAKTKLSRNDCLNRLTEWHSNQGKNTSGPGMSMQSTGYDENFISVRKNTVVRVACPEKDNNFAVSVTLPSVDNNAMDTALEISGNIINLLQ